MGTKMAPAYTNLFMGLLETKLTHKNIFIWKRYIDDIFIIWTSSMTELETYIKHINSIHPTIKFTYEVNKEQLTFLDITLYKGERFKQHNILDVKTHIKKTNEQLYIHEKSYHPTTTKRGIIKGETTRYLRKNANNTAVHRFTL